MKKDRIFIAGSRGFLGRALKRRLSKSKAIILKDDYRENDDYTILENCVKIAKRISCLVNSAGIVTSRKNQLKRPAEIFYTNTLLNFQLLEACLRAKVGHYITFSSITAYPRSRRGKLKEDLIFNGEAPFLDKSFGFYGFSRWLAPFIAKSYSLQFGIKSRVVIFPNLYGQQDKFSHKEPPLVPNLIKNLHLAAKKGDKFFYGGENQNENIDLLFIDDAARFVESVIRDFGKELFICVNAGSGRTISIGSIVSFIAKEIGFRGRILWGKNKNPNPPKRFLDNNLARKMYGWKPQVSFEEGIKKTVAWYLKNCEDKD